jgi:hypothetical protein
MYVYDDMYFLYVWCNLFSDQMPGNGPEGGKTCPAAVWHLQTAAGSRPKRLQDEGTTMKPVYNITPRGSCSHVCV